MNSNPKSKTSANDALKYLNEGKPLLDLYIEGNLIIEINDNWDKEIILDNCIIENFTAINQQFAKSVKIKNSHFKKCQFCFSYFLGGLHIENCTFDNDLDFSSGGHNKDGNIILITNNEFNGFVDFFDCWYESEIIISNNKFLKGTNLLAKPYNIDVTFDIEPIMFNNLGKLDVEYISGVKPKNVLSKILDYLHQKLYLKFN